MSTPPGHLGFAKVYIFDADKRYLMARACAADGGFRLPLASGSRFYLVGTAERLAPQTIVLDLAGDVSPVPHRMALDVGATVEGIAYLDGEPYPSYSSLGIERNGEFEPLLGDRSLAWSGERIVRIRSSTQGDAEGRFVFSGLDPGDHRIKLSPQIPPSERDGTMMTVVGARYHAVTAPASGVRVEIDTLSQDVIVRGDGAPLDGASVQAVRAEEERNYLRFQLTTGADGRVRFLIAPDVEHQIVVGRTGYLGRTVALLRGGLGEALIVDLQRDGEPSAVLLRVDTGGLPAPAELEVRLRGLDNRLFLRRRVTGGATGYLLHDLLSGEYDVDVRVPDPTEEQAYLIPLEFLLRVPEGEQIERIVVMERGGKFRVTATGFEEDLVNVKWFVRDATGGVVATRLAGPTPANRWKAGKAKRLSVPLAAGTYQLSLDATGFEPWRAEVIVRSGESTAVEAALIQR